MVSNYPGTFKYIKFKSEKYVELLIVLTALFWVKPWDRYKYMIPQIYPSLWIFLGTLEFIQS